MTTKRQQLQYDEHNLMAYRGLLNQKRQQISKLQTESYALEERIVELEALITKQKNEIESPAVPVTVITAVGVEPGVLTGNTVTVKKET